MVEFAILAAFLLALLSVWALTRRPKPPPQWVDIPGDPLTLAHRELLAEVMRRKVAGTLNELDRADLDAIFIRVKRECAPPSDKPPREALRLITSLPLSGRGRLDDERDEAPVSKLILTGRE